ncbi:hypothetical protein FRB96_006456 [Tulasnella sp. 330]|nr:hypothetical protein FRB96_006456 [Tulasnella sp. 330]KAG8882231.1 hypothetical protein FRB98_003857 [Tulasnella sp. 332]
MDEKRQPILQPAEQQVHSNHRSDLFTTPPAYTPNPNAQVQSDYKTFPLPPATTPPPPTQGYHDGMGVLPPPRRISSDYNLEDDPSNPVSYIRDPHKLIAYLIPFPKPTIGDLSKMPDRFLIYTPPAPPLSKPPEGVKESKVHKIQRKWQEEVREAKTSNAKTASWKGIKGKVTRGINWAINKTTSADLDFLNRIPTEDSATSGSGSSSNRRDSHDSDGVEEGDETHRTVGLEELVLVYPTSFGSNPEAVKKEFVDSMMRTKSKAQRDAIIATGLLPVAAAIDILATLIWPFGGLLEIDGVWAFSSIRGAKTARSVTKRLTSSTKTGQLTESGDLAESPLEEMPSSTTATSGGNEDTLHLRLTPSNRVEVIRRYLAMKCYQLDPKVFSSPGTGVTESEVLEALGWSPAQTNGEMNWEDEAWQESQVKADLISTMAKGAKAWDKWCKLFAKHPQKALKK